MKNNLTALVVGLIFGAGLIVSGMTLPEKVIGFLDITGNWDPSLAFVMVGAIGVHMIAYRFIIRRPHPVFSSRFLLPTKKDLDRPLILGSAIFGLGWGLGGLCPGPGLTSVLSGNSQPIYFAIFFLMGLSIVRILEMRKKER